jgi:D-alanine-D-alanine ligase
MTMRIGFAFNLKPRRIGLGADDAYLEWDDDETIARVEAALATCGDVRRLEANAEFPERLRKERPDIVFNMAEGLHGRNREAHVPAICEFFNVPYTGSDVATLCNCLDKSRTKDILRINRIATARWQVADDESQLDSLDVSTPVIVKPLHEGSSRGIFQRSLCRSLSEVKKAVVEIRETCYQPALVEEWLPGREFTCAVLGNGPAARALPIVEIRLDVLPRPSEPIYSYEAKWVWDTPSHELSLLACPADVSETLEREVAAAALAAYGALQCRDWARVDLRCDSHGVPNVMEVNPLPGIHPDPRAHSSFPIAARAAGLSYDDLIRSVITSADHRLSLR